MWFETRKRRGGYLPLSVIVTESKMWQMGLLHGHFPYSSSRSLDFWVCRSCGVVTVVATEIGAFWSQDHSNGILTLYSVEVLYSWFSPLQSFQLFRNPFFFSHAKINCNWNKSLLWSLGTCQNLTPKRSAGECVYLLSWPPTEVPLEQSSDKHFYGLGFREKLVSVVISF